MAASRVGYMWRGYQLTLTGQDHENIGASLAYRGVEHQEAAQEMSQKPGSCTTNQPHEL